MSISQVAAVKPEINPKANGGILFGCFKILQRHLSIESPLTCHNRVHQSGITFKADIKAYHMMKDFPIRALQRNALNPVHVCIRACWCLLKTSSFTGRHSLWLLQAFPRNINLGREREESPLNLLVLKVSIWRKQAQVEGDCKDFITMLFKRRQNACSFLAQDLWRI